MGIDGKAELLAFVCCQIFFPLRDAGRRVIGCGKAGNATALADGVDRLKKPSTFVDLVITEILEHRWILGVVDEVMDESEKRAIVPDEG
jgi:hypothetical protein